MTADPVSPRRTPEQRVRDPQDPLAGLDTTHERTSADLVGQQPGPSQPQAASVPAEHWQTLLDTVVHQVWIIAPSGTVLHLNRSLSGQDPRKIVGTRIYDHLEPDSAARLATVVEQVMATGMPTSFEAANRTAQSIERYTIRVAPLRSGDEITSLAVIIADTTEANHRLAYESDERRRAEAELARSEAVKSALIDIIPDMIFEYDRDGTIQWFKPGRDLVPLVPPKEFLGRRVQEVLPTPAGELILAAIQRVLQNRGMETLEYQLLRDGEIRDYEGRMLASGPDSVYLLVRNITDRKRAEEALRSHVAQVRRLTMDTGKRLEEERAWISRELHDELGQLLTALRLNLSWVRGHVPSTDPTLQTRFTEATDLIDQSVDAVRNLAKRLRPPILDQKGLLDAVRTQAAELQQRSGVWCEVAASPRDLEVADPLATVVYRIVQEALTNVARHAQATRCRVTLKLKGEMLEVAVRDNGIGASPERLSGRNSLGIIGMTERATGVGGTLHIVPNRGGGLCVRASLPLSRWTT